LSPKTTGNKGIIPENANELASEKFTFCGRFSSIARFYFCSKNFEIKNFIFHFVISYTS
jgi:hypothetical protein